MANLQTDVYLGKRSTPQPDGAEVIEVPIDFTFAAAQATLSTGDLIELIKDVPPGVKLVDFYIITQQLDSNGTPTLAFSLGSENAGRTDLTTVYEASLTPGRTATGNIVKGSTAVPANADATIARAFALKCTTAAATWAGGGKTMKVVLLLQG